MMLFTHRRSKDLEDAMNDMTEGTADTASDVAKLASSASSDEDLAKLFKEIGACPTAHTHTQPSH